MNHHASHREAPVTALADSRSIATRLESEPRARRPLRKAAAKPKASNPALSADPTPAAKSPRVESEPRARRPLRKAAAKPKASNPAPSADSTPAANPPRVESEPRARRPLRKAAAKPPASSPTPSADSTPAANPPGLRCAVSEPLADVASPSSTFTPEVKAPRLDAHVNTGNQVADPSPDLDASSTPARSKAQEKMGAQERSAMRIVALDLGGAKTSYCEVNDGQVVERATVKSLSELARLLGPNTPPAKVAFEACREAWVVHDQLQAWGHQPLMLDTTRVRQLGIGQHRRKNDRIDAETMARALETGRVPLAHVLSPRRRELRLQLSVRRTLVETRAGYVTTVRGLVRAHGKQLPTCKTDHFLEHLRQTPLDETTRALITPLDEALKALNPQIALVNAKLEQLCAEEPVIKRLGTVPGVGLIVAAAFVSVIDEAKRFRGAHQVESYLGLVPSENTSVKRRLGAITKQGNSYVRALLVEAAQCVFRLRADDPLKRWGQSVEQRGGKRKAVVAVARRLAGILWAMWRDGTVYNPTKLGLTAAAGLSSHARALTHEAEQQRVAVTPTANRRSPTAAAAAFKTPREEAVA
jgi:transposase